MRRSALPAALLALALALSACGGSNTPTNTPSASATTTAPATTTASTSPASASAAAAYKTGAAFTKWVKAWEAENAVDTSEWYSLVTGYNRVSESQVDITTALFPDADAKDPASRMCGTYGQLSLADPAITTVTIRDKQGGTLRTCGLG